MLALRVDFTGTVSSPTDQASTRTRNSQMMAKRAMKKSTPSPKTVRSPRASPCITESAVQKKLRRRNRRRNAEVSQNCPEIFWTT